MGEGSKKSGWNERSPLRRMGPEAGDTFHRIKSPTRESSVNFKIEGEGITSPGKETTSTDYRLAVSSLRHQLEQNERNSERRIVTLNDEVTRLTSGIAELESRLAVNRTVGRGQEEVEKLIEDYETKVRSLQDAHSLKAEEVNACRSRIHDLELQVDQTEGMISANVQEAIGMAVTSLNEEQREKVYDMLSRQGASLMGLANRHLEGRDTELQQMAFEVEKKDRVISCLRDEIRRRDEALHQLNSMVDEAERDCERAAKGGVAAAAQHEADANARVALSTAELYRYKSNHDQLKERFARLEEEGQRKDNEIRTCRQSLAEAETQRAVAERTIVSLKFELDLKEVQLAEVEKAGFNREGELAAKIRVMKEERDSVIRSECQRRELQVEDRQRDVTALRGELENAGMANNELNERISQNMASLRDKDRVIAHLQGQIAEFEAKLHVNDRSVEVGLLRNRERELKSRLQEYIEQCEVLQHDSAILAKTRSENVALRSTIIELRSVVTRLQEQQTQAKSEVSPPSRRPAPAPIYGPSGEFTTSRTGIIPYAHGRDRTLQDRGHLEEATSAPLSPNRNRGFSSGQLAATSRGDPNYHSSLPSHPQNNLGRHISYKPRSLDPIDGAMAQYINTNQHRIPFSIERVDDGLYLFGTKRYPVSLIKGELLVHLGNSMLGIAEFVASERHAQHKTSGAYNVCDPMLKRPINSLSTLTSTNRGGSPPPNQSLNNRAGKTAPSIDPFKTAAALPHAPQGDMGLG
eukprot:GHVN01066092.1.p1 GENE.GHVN01066092.1~~GHVN01066092.1.p1  ORF type:complete len:752 (+),score=155.62 GHVN01066092.1:5042-7297(+)